MNTFPIQFQNLLIIIFRPILLFRLLFLIFNIEVIISIQYFFKFKMYNFVVSYNCYNFIIYVQAACNFSFENVYNVFHKSFKGHTLRYDNGVFQPNLL